MNEKHREVNAWLECQFGGDAVPPYEVDTYTTDHLYQLMKKNEECDHFCGTILADIQEKTEEYRVEAVRLSRILDKLGFLPASLSQSGKNSLSSLSNTALILDVPDASDTNLLLATSELSQKSMKIAEERRMEQRFSAQLFNKKRAARIQANNLERALTGLEEQSQSQAPDLHSKAKQAAFLTTKAKEYKRHVQELQKELTQNKMEPSIYHSTLLKKSEEFKLLREQLLPMKSKLSSYHQLPPDMALAKVKVEEVKRDLEEIEEELTRHINVMHM